MGDYWTTGWRHRNGLRPDSDQPVVILDWSGPIVIATRPTKDPGYSKGWTDLPVGQPVRVSLSALRHATPPTR